MHEIIDLMKISNAPHIHFEMGLWQIVRGFSIDYTFAWPLAYTFPTVAHNLD